MTPNPAAVRRRLINPPNAVVDRGIQMRNGWPVRFDPPRPAAPPPAKPRPAVIRRTLDLPPTSPPAVEQCAPVEIQQKYPRVEQIVAVVARAYGFPVLEIHSSRRYARIITPRHIAMYLAKTLTLKSFPEIGRRIGGRDHTTVLYAVNKIAHMIAMDPEFAAHIESLKAAIVPPQQEAA